MSAQSDDNEKSFEPTPQKLREARKRGEIARSADLQTAAAYFGFTLSLFLSGPAALSAFGTALSVPLDQADQLSQLVFRGDPRAPVGGILARTAWPLMPIFVLPALAVLVCVAAQKGFVFAPSKLAPKLSRISLVANAKNKFGRAGLFEFAKSFTKLLVFSGVLAFFLRSRLPEMLAALQGDPGRAVALMGNLLVAFLGVVVLVSGVIGGIDALWQHFEHHRKNRMSRREITDETKEAEGDPYLKRERRARAETIATRQMMADVPNSEVVIVNPTHFAVALAWDRMPGSAPKCLAKGVDEIALRIRELAIDAAVPIHRDPPTARALHAVVDVGREIAPEHYEAVAVAIRFADAMREKVRKGV